MTNQHNSDEILPVSDDRAIYRYLESNPCECGGPWRRLSEDKQAKGDSPISSVKVECQLCGLQKVFRFSIDSDTQSWLEMDQRDRDISEPREHHYIFGHIVVPQLFFGDPNSFMSSFPCTDLGDERLMRLWKQVGREEGDQGKDEVAPSGLSIRRETISCGEISLIVMPEAVGATEVALAALIPASDEPASLARYIVLERTEIPDVTEPYGVICEWFADQRRKNHERHCRLNIDEFLESLNRLLLDEQKVASPGAFGLPSWRPGADDPSTLTFGREGYRLELCRVAFELVPIICNEEIDSLVQAVEQGQGNDFLLACLKLRSTPGDDFGDAISWPMQEMQVEELAIGEQRCLIIQMPSPIAPPEPQFIAILFGRNVEDIDRAYCCTGIYTAEMAISGGGAQWLLGHIEGGSHSIISDIESESMESFMNAVHQHMLGTPFQCSSGVLEHLVLYVAISSKNKGSN